MDLLVRDVEKILIASDCRIIAGASGADKKVTGINVIESPNILSYLEGGEILITSLYPHIFMPYSYIDFFQMLTDKNVSAVMIKIGNYVNTVPQDLIGFCNDHGLPLFQLPEKTYFSDIIYQVTAAQCNRESVRFQIHTAVTEKLIKILAQGGDCLSKMMEFLSEMLGHDMALICEDDSILFSNHQNVVNWETIDANIYSVYSIAKGENQIVNEEGTLVCVPILQQMKEISHIIIFDCQEDITDYFKVVLEDASVMLSVEIIKEQSIKAVERHFMYNVLDQLMLSEYVDKDHFMEYLQNIGWKTEGYYCVMIMEFIHLHQSPIIEKSARGLVARLERCIKNIIGHETHVYVRQFDNSINVLWKTEECSENLQQLIEALNAGIDQIVDERLTETAYYVGYGKVVEDIDKIHISYQQAKEAVKVGKLFNRTYVSYQELGILRLLTTVSEGQKLEEFIPNVLNRIRLYDKENGTEYFETILAFYKNNCNAAAAAKDLFIHYKTILRRIERIQELFQIDIKDNGLRLELEIGIQVIQFQQKE